MAIPTWNLTTEPSRREQLLLKRLTRTRKLFAFLRLHRHDLFDASFQEELAGMYRNTGSGKEPLPPAMLAMATLLQAYTGTSDAEAVELSIVDARWQMVLGVLGDEQPAFSQGALQAFRERLIAHDMDRRLLERTVGLAQRTKEFDWKKLPKTLRLAVDSRPLVDAARVEDTINLLGCAARDLLCSAAHIAELETADLAREIEAPLLVATSIKKGLDVDWTDPAQRREALQELLEQITALEKWVRANLAEESNRPPLSAQLETLASLREQDLEPDPAGGSSGRKRIKKGVAKERRISIRDPEMRHAP